MYTSILLILVLIFGTLASLILYRFQGRKNFIRLDIVQFCYVFIFYPIFFVWLKTFVYVQVKSGLGINLTPNEFFVIDTAVALAGLYLYAFFAMKALTKSLYLYKQKDPLTDLFQHTEYFHLWISHIAGFVGVAIILMLVSGINLIITLQLNDSLMTNFMVLALGIFSGIMLYIMLLLSNPKQDGFRLLKIVKLTYGFIFTVFVAVYLIKSPSFNSQYVLYWYSFFLFATFTVCSFFSNKSVRANLFLERITDLFRDTTWGNNITLLKQKKK